MTDERTPTQIDRLAEGWLDTQLDLYPEMRVYLGRPGRVGEYGDYSPSGQQAAVDAARAALADIEAAEPADEVDTITKLDLTRELQLEIEKHDAAFWQRDLNNIASPLQNFRDIFDLAPTATADDWAAIATRMSNVPAAIRGYVESLRVGMSSGNAPAVRQVRIGIQQADELAARDGFFTKLIEGARTSDGAEVPDSVKADLFKGAQAAAAAYGELSYFLDDELQHEAPERDAVGRDIYALASRGFLGATVDLDETYEWGIDELARMTAEQEAIARQIVPDASVREAIEFLDRDPARKLHGTDALKQWMQETADRAVAELSGSHFDIPEPLRALECMIAPTQNGGIYYTSPSEDFSRPGQMWWSVPPGVTEFDTWRELTTVYHEGVPGHHLQLGTAVYNTRQLNAWRRNQFVSGHGEGWALYAERLMEQLGYLDDPADRLGMLDGQRMRAARVVLDLGVHLEKPLPDGSGIWTGDYAFGFMGRNVNMDQGFVDFEVNRYLGWPGQAPAYKIGQREWERIRDELAARDGDAFDIKAFHKRALDLGGVGLETLRTALLA
ncbi:DUF885 domain-containing protein [Gryllotalpicola reticulitermitis]|uniref:DUF885 domain-containing protein n=1 Tax=Gryllotalpicola reticulitermitis TaxID=1184153 RepID=A0ABV8Q8E9_9MICO